MRCMEAEVQKIQDRKGLIKLVAVASIAAGVQFGWALQLSLLTPYVQLLGIPHEWASLIWLCGPISGLLVQPTVGYFSDRCTSRFGRRRPFIVSGSALAALSVFCIGFAADIGMAMGDKLSVDDGIKPRAFVLFIVGFWILNVANNMLQGPLRAFLADLSDGDSTQVRLSNSLYSFFMAVGNVAGFGAGSYGNLYKIMPFTFTLACDVYCANLKALFIISIALLLSLTVIALCIVKEERFHHTPSDDKDSEGDDGVITAFRKLPRSMRALMLVTALNWIGWFPFVLYDTDWMGKEVYGGETKSENYADGVRAGALGLTLQSLTLSVVSLLIDPLSRLVRMNRLWAAANFVLASGLALTAAVTKAAASHRHQYGSDSPPTLGIKASALSLFVLLGFPLAVTFSIPFALASIYSHTTGAGQGLSLAILNLAIVIPQTLVSFLSGPCDTLFGGGNFPAFAVGAIAAGISSVLAWTVLPEPSSLDYTSDSEDDYQI